MASKAMASKQAEQVFNRIVAFCLCTSPTIWRAVPISGWVLSLRSKLTDQVRVMRQRGPCYWKHFEVSAKGGTPEENTWSAMNKCRAHHSLC